MSILRQIKAKLLNTFTADCPCCHKPFYGGKHKEQVKIKGKHYRILCPVCVKKHSVE